MYKESFYDKYIRYSFIGILFSKIRSTYFNIKYGIENLIKWFPIIWNDRDWDYYFLIKLMRFKTEQMSKLHKEYGHCLDSSKYAKQLKKVSIALKRIEEDDYMYQEDKVFNRSPKYLTKPDNLRFFNDYMRQKDLDYVLKMMKRNLFKWWD